MNKAYKFRIYLNQNQKIQFEKNFGSVRFLYNYLLAEVKRDYESSKFQGIKGNRINKSYFQSKIKFLKETNELNWLNEVHSQIRQNASNQLTISFDKFFSKLSGYPKFKKKKEYNSFSVPQYFEVNEKNQTIKIPKIKELIKVKLSKKLKGSIRSLTFSKTKTNKYFVSILTEQEKEIFQKTGKSIGIDVNVKESNTFCFSDGIKEQLPKTKKKELEKLKSLNKILSRKKVNSRRYKQISLQIARIYEKIVNRKTDFLHKLSNQITNDYDVISVENLKIQNMVKNHKLARSIQDCNWGQFFQMLEYKSKWKDKIFKKVNPRNTSKTCNYCGNINTELKFEEFWICPVCKKEIDRDVNASLNIEKRGLELISYEKSAESLTKVKAMKRSDMRIIPYIA